MQAREGGDVGQTAVGAHKLDASGARRRRRGGGRGRLLEGLNAATKRVVEAVKEAVNVAFQYWGQVGLQDFLVSIIWHAARLPGVRRRLKMSLLRRF